MNRYQIETLKLEKAPDYADSFEKNDWLQFVKFGAFIPDDGCGMWAAKSDDGFLYESTDHDAFGPAPEWATHVAWYNK